METGVASWTECYKNGAIFLRLDAAVKAIEKAGRSAINKPNRKERS